MELNDKDIQRFKQLLLETYDAFFAFCEKHNIRFYAAYGTELGAVRHNGLIPWDDDIDVFMIEEDYMKFLSLKSELVGGNYEIVDLDTPGYYCPFAKFASRKNTIWEYRDLPCLYGVYIDIFPLYRVQGTLEQLTMPFKKYCNDINNFRLTSLQRSWDCIFDFFKQRRIRKALFYLGQKAILPLARPFFLSKIKRGFHINEEGKPYLTSPFDDMVMRKLLYNPEWFKDIVMMPFDGREIPVPVGYDAMLTTTYGDYMTPPPVEQRVTHHAHYYFNLEKRVSIEEARKELKENGN